jgi:predicted ATPase
VLAAPFPETVETQPELLAHHETEAGRTAQAVGSWPQAGQRATQRSAPVEAVAHLRTGLLLRALLPDTPERARPALALQGTRGPACMAVQGWASAEVAHVYAQARALCQQIGDTPRVFPVLWGVGAFHVVPMACPTAPPRAAPLLALAESAHDPAPLRQAPRALGQTLFWCGALVPARLHLEQRLALYDPQQHHAALLL